MTKQLSGRELEVMKIFWESGEAYTASQVGNINPDLSINTIHAVLKSLLKRNYIRVDEIVYSGTVLTRSYRPAVTMAEYVRDSFFHSSTVQAVAAFVEQVEDQDTLNEVKNLIKTKQKALEGK